MRGYRALLRASVFMAFGLAFAGCGEATSTDNKPIVVAPDVAPAEAQKDSMNDYLKSHPNAAKKAGKGMAP